MSHSNFLSIDRVVSFVGVAFVVGCVILGIKQHSLFDGDAAAASPTTIGTPTGADAPADTDEEKQGEDTTDPRRSGWPKVDRGRLRFGVVHDVADAFATGKDSDLVSLSSESQQRLFDDWCERAAAWPHPWNRAPILFADGGDRDGARSYRVELHGEELGRIYMDRHANGWNIVGVERKMTKTALDAEERIVREAAARAGVVRNEAGIKTSETSNRERAQRDQ